MKFSPHCIYNHACLETTAFSRCWVFSFYKQQKKIVLPKGRIKLARCPSGNWAGNPQLQMLRLIISHTYDVCAHNVHKSTCLIQRKQKRSKFMDYFSFIYHRYISLLTVYMHSTYTENSNSYIWCLLLLTACHMALPSV